MFSLNVRFSENARQCTSVLWALTMENFKGSKSVGDQVWGNRLIVKALKRNTEGAQVPRPRDRVNTARLDSTKDGSGGAMEARCHSSQGLPSTVDGRNSGTTTGLTRWLSKRAFFPQHWETLSMHDAQLRRWGSGARTTCPRRADSIQEDDP